VTVEGQRVDFRPARGLAGLRRGTNRRCRWLTVIPPPLGPLIEGQPCLFANTCTKLRQAPEWPRFGVLARFVRRTYGAAVLAQSYAVTAVRWFLRKVRVS
jgi:hypothetical protein